MVARQVPPSIELRSFSCAHCGTLTTQTWFDLFAVRCKDGETPQLWTQDKLDELLGDGHHDKAHAEAVASLKEHLEKGLTGNAFLDPNWHGEKWTKLYVGNLNISHCYDCKKLTVWIRDRILHPPMRHGVEPSADLPEGVHADYEEARSILDLSPRGAAALLRLAIQKLCVALGEKGKDLNTDIGSLVKKGLDKRVQMALDTVRVVGNEAVHPGQMDLRDDRDTAVELLRLVNVISEIMISQPKHLEEMYGRIPPAKRKAIEERDS